VHNSEQQLQHLNIQIAEARVSLTSETQKVCAVLSN
jgi:hypothetical protein